MENQIEQEYSSSDVALMMEEIDELQDQLTRLHCVEHDMDYDDASDYSKACSAVSQGVDISMYQEARQLQAAEEGGFNVLSEYGFSLKNLWRGVRNVRDSYVNKAKNKWEKAKDWKEEKKKKAEKLKIEAKDKAAVLSFTYRVRRMNKQYKSEMAGMEAYVQKECSGAPHEKLTKCQKYKGKKFKTQCSDRAMAHFSAAQREFQRRAGSKKLQMGASFINAFEDYPFDKFLRELNDYIRTNHPEYVGYLKYI